MTLKKIQLAFRCFRGSARHSKTEKWLKIENGYHPTHIWIIRKWAQLVDRELCTWTTDGNFSPVCNRYNMARFERLKVHCVFENSPWRFDELSCKEFSFNTKATNHCLIQTKRTNSKRIIWQKWNVKTKARFYHFLLGKWWSHIDTCKFGFFFLNRLIIDEDRQLEINKILDLSR